MRRAISGIPQTYQLHISVSLMIKRFEMPFIHKLAELIKFNSSHESHCVFGTSSLTVSATSRFSFRFNCSLVCFFSFRAEKNDLCDGNGTSANVSLSERLCGSKQWSWNNTKDHHCASQKFATNDQLLVCCVSLLCRLCILFNFLCDNTQSIYGHRKMTRAHTRARLQTTYQPFSNIQSPKC